MARAPLLAAPGHTGAEERERLALTLPLRISPSPCCFLGAGWGAPKGTERSKPVQKVPLRARTRALGQTSLQKAVWSSATLSSTLNFSSHSYKMKTWDALMIYLRIYFTI